MPTALLITLEVWAGRAASIIGPLWCPKLCMEAAVPLCEGVLSHLGKARTTWLKVPPDLGLLKAPPVPQEGNLLKQA